jgi:hypothetical protein
MAGRVVLLLAAYAPVAVIAGIRAAPRTAGWVAVALGLAGITAWIVFLAWLPHRQARSVSVIDVEYVDAEVTGYVVSLLLPLLAAVKPRLEDWVAYGVCAVLILLVAYAAELWSINPVTYAFGMRTARASVDGRRTVVLMRGHVAEGHDATVVRRIGVTLILGDADG